MSITHTHTHTLGAQWCSFRGCKVDSPGSGGGGGGCIGRAGASEAAPAAVGQAVGGGCQSGWGRLLSVTNAIEAGTCHQGDSGWA